MHGLLLENDRSIISHLTSRETLTLFCCKTTLELACGSFNLCHMHLTRIKVPSRRKAACVSVDKESGGHVRVYLFLGGMVFIFGTMHHLIFIYKCVDL